MHSSHMIGRRPGRLKAILLLVGSLVFVAAGVFVLLFGPVLLGLVVIAFFGGCALIGLTQLLGADHPVTPILMGVGSIGMGLGCLAMLAGALSGSPSGPGDWVLVAIMLIGALFFGVGGVLLILLPLLRRRRSVQPQVPSPVLPLAEVEAMLDGRLSQLGGMGGGIGGGLGEGSRVSSGAAPEVRSARRSAPATSPVWTGSGSCCRWPWISSWSSACCGRSSRAGPNGGGPRNGRSS